MGGGDSVVFSLCVNDWEKGIRSDVMGVMDRTVSGLLSAANGLQKRGSDTRQPGSELCPTRRGQEIDVCESLRALALILALTPRRSAITHELGTFRGTDTIS